MKQSDLINLKRMMQLLIAYKRKIIALFLLLIISTVVVLFQPQIWARILNDISGNFNIFNICIWALIMLACQILNSILDIFQTKVTVFIQEEIVEKMRVDILENVLNMRIQKFIKMNSGELLSKITGDISEIASVLVQEIVNIIFNVVKIVIICIFLFSTNVVLAIIVIVYYIINLFTLKRHEMRMRLNCQKSSEINDQYIENMEMVVNGVVEIQNLGIEDAVLENSKKIIYLNKKADMDVIHFNLKYQLEVQASNYISQFIILVAGIIMMDNAGVTFPEFVAFSSYATIFSTAIMEVYDIKSAYISCFNSLERFWALMDNCNNEKKKVNRNKQEVYTPKIIRLQNVSYEYISNIKACNNVNMTFELGKINYIVGRSGTGKTTILMILLGLYEDYQGTIYVDNKRIQQCNQKEIINKVALISQAPFFLNDTILENLRIVNKSKTEEEIYDVCRKIGIHKEIMIMTNQYDTILKNNASNLSTGQRQRLSIARVLLLEPQILLCDEIFSNIDQQTRMQILNVVKEIAEKRMVIFVTHQTELISHQDNILYMDDNRL